MDQAKTKKSEELGEEMSMSTLTPEVERTWIEVLEHRTKEYETGKTTARPAAEVLAEVRTEIDPENQAP